MKNRARFLELVDKMLVQGGVFAVITPVYRQDTDATPISVNFDLTFRELKSKFKTVTIFEETGDMVTFVCRKG